MALLPAPDVPKNLNRARLMSGAGSAYPAAACTKLHPAISTEFMVL
jgi:hypothetical protein